MISRGGTPKEIHSNNGTDMKGAYNLLPVNNQKLITVATDERFKWVLIPS